MKYLLFPLAAVVSYLIAGLNPAILLSTLIYHQDIRECGSKNPGFTNFKRCFGMRWAWLVMVIDLLKSALPAVLFGVLFRMMWADWQLGVSFACIFAMLGHAYPIWYEFRGGKGFLVCLASMWALDWRVGFVATLLMVVLLLITKYMSYATVVAMLTCPITLMLASPSTTVFVLCGLAVCFMAWRHKENFKRLLAGTETKFKFKRS